MNSDDELVGAYLAECCEHLATIETGLTAIQKAGTEIDEQLLNSLLRAVRSVGGLAFFDLKNISKLALAIEDVLTLIRSRKIGPTPDRVGVLLVATGRLRELIQDRSMSGHADIIDIVADLTRTHPGEQAPDNRSCTCFDQGHPGDRRLRVLIVEDDAASRLLLKTFLCRYGDCRIAVNGTKAVDAVRSTLERGERYDLICMDIMMPEMDGHEAVRSIRALEADHGISPTSGAKIFMTTAVDDIEGVVRCFREFCDAYLVKPIDLHSLRRQMKTSQLID